MMLSEVRVSFKLAQQRGYLRIVPPKDEQP